MKKKAKKTVKKQKRKRNKKNQGKFFLFFLIIIVLIVSFITYYAVVLFPKKLTDKINNDIISIYKPVYYELSDNLLLLKLSDKPGYLLQKQIYDEVKNKYGLETKFEKILGDDDKGINYLSFFRNKNIFNDINPVYIYWDSKIDYIPLKENKVIEKDNNEIIEYKVKKIKKEKIKKPDKNIFKKPVKIIKNKDKAKISIIIDDMGYSYNSTYDFLTLGFPVTFACIPDMEYSKYFYNLFNQYGYDIIIHLPMEPLKGKKYVEKNAIFTDMNDEQIKNKIQYFLNEYPSAIGANNHMGSKAVSDPRVMNIIFQELSVKKYFWLDSRTTSNTVAKEVANLHNLSYYKRDFFLDNDKDYSSIKKSMDSLIKYAKKNGKAIGIGHIQTKELIPILKDYYNKSDELGIEFIFLKDL